MLNKLLESLRLRPVKNRDELRAVALETAAKQLEVRKLTAGKNDAVLRAEAPFDETIQSLEEEIAKGVARMKVFATDHRGELFGDEKTTKVGAHKLCFRSTPRPGKVSTIDGIKEAEVLTKILSLGDEHEATISRLVKAKPSLDKNAVKAVWESGDEGRELLRGVGLELVRDEWFAFEPDFDEVPTEQLKA